MNNQPTGFNYDYFVKDHLGNTRMVLTDEQEKDIYPAATLEGTYNDAGTALGFEQTFYTIDPDNIVDKSLDNGITDYQNNNGIASPYPSGNSGNTNVNNNSTKLYKLLAVSSGGVNGLGMTLKVMSGDKIDIMGKSYYPTANTGGLNYSIPVMDILTGLLGAPGGAAADKGFTPSGLNGDPNVTSPLNGFLNDPNRESGTVPKAYINWILFDENFKQVSGGFSRVGSAGVVKDHYGDPSMQNIAVTKNGYIYVYVSNESPVAVFFDNLQVIHTRGPLLEETHYYPFGLTMAGISSKAFKTNYAENKSKFTSKELQSKEFVDASGLEWTDFGARMYDQQIGRWHRTDGKAELYFATSPYVYSLNQPTHAVDPDGNLVIFINGMNWGNEGGKPEYWRSYENVKVGLRSERDWLGRMHTSEVHQQRQTQAFDEAIMDRLEDYHAIYRDGSHGGALAILAGNLSPTQREIAGSIQGGADAAMIIASLARDKNGNIIESIKIISHSMGGAYAKGYVQAILDYASEHKIEGVKVAFEADFAPYQPQSQKAIKDKNMGPTLQFSHKDDKIAGNSPMPGAEQMNTESDQNQIHSIMSFFNEISQLPAGNYKVVEGKIIPDN